MSVPETEDAIRKQMILCGFDGCDPTAWKWWSALSRADRRSLLRLSNGRRGKMLLAADLGADKKAQARPQR